MTFEPPIVVDRAHGDAARLFLGSAKIVPASPDLRLLSAVTRAYAALPYENITKILRYHEHGDWERRLRMPGDVVDEHLRWRTGGTCFSLAYCLERILRHVGFDTALAMADMPSGPDLHCAVVVAVRGARYLVDPGFLLPRPVRLPESGAVTTPGAGRVLRLERRGEAHVVSTVGPDGPRLRYILKDAPVVPAVFFARWIRSFELPLLNGVVVSAAREGSHLYLHNNYFRTTRGGIVSKESVRARYGDRVEEMFGIRGELVEKAREILIRSGTSRIRR